jgi:hypothetical protein
MAQSAAVLRKSKIVDSDEQLPPLKPAPVPERGFAMEMMGQRRWPEAARLFRIALSKASEPALWMQYGHALKEAGFLEEAGVAYSKAQEGIGPTLDMHVQLGHWNKIVGQFNKAEERYLNADQHPNAGLETRHELRALLDPLRRVTRPVDVESRDEVQIFFSCIAGRVDAAPAPHRLGRSNYSYSFAMRGFQRAADDLGLAWTYLDAPHYVADAQKLTRTCRPIHVAFYPWSRARLLKGAYNILAFAWEFEILPEELNWAHAFSRPGAMLDLFDEIWVPSSYGAKVVQRYTARRVSHVPSPVLPPTDRRIPIQRHRVARRSTAAALRDLQHVEWVPLSVFPRMQPNFNNHALSRRRRTRELFSEYVKGKAPRVYLSVFNPHDRRKQIRPMIEGFMKFSKRVPDAVLLLKTASPDDTNHSINSRLLSHQLAEADELLRPFVSERIWISNATLSEAEMSALYAVSSYYVCTSYAEGQNLPPLEAMSEGVIPISIRHTATADYISPANSIIIPDTIAEAPQVIQETYRLWGQSVHTVTADDVCQALHASENLTAADAERLSREAVATVAERYGSPILEEALSRVLSPVV